MIWLNGKVVEFGKFPNGETLVKHESFKESMKAKAIRFDFKYDSDEDLIHLMFVKRKLEDANPYAFTELYIQYMPYSRMDRSENGSVFTLEYVSDFINDLKFTQVTVNEPHSEKTLELLENSTSILTSVDFLKKAKTQIEFDEEEDYIVLPDKGAFERYDGLDIGKNILIGNKHRDFKTGRITSLVIDTPMTKTGKKAIILDDLSSKGGTFIMTSIDLKSKGVETVVLVVGHAENAIYDGQLLDHVDHVYTSDSILSVNNHWANIKHASKVHVQSAMSVNYLPVSIKE